MGWMNGEMLYKYPISLSRSTYRGDSVELRADVGIGPYIRVIYRDELIFAVISRTLLVMASSFAFRAASTRRMA